jgi:hypothetical protein
VVRRVADQVARVAVGGTRSARQSVCLQAARSGAITNTSSVKLRPISLFRGSTKSRRVSCERDRSAAGTMFVAQPLASVLRGHEREVDSWRFYRLCRPQRSRSKKPPPLHIHQGYHILPNRRVSRADRSATGRRSPAAGTGGALHCDAGRNRNAMQAIGRASWEGDDLDAFCYGSLSIKFRPVALRWGARNRAGFRADQIVWPQEQCLWHCH